VLVVFFDALSLDFRIAVVHCRLVTAVGMRNATLIRNIRRLIQRKAPGGKIVIGVADKSKFGKLSVARDIEHQD
jgi:hypothetical protein